MKKTIITLLTLLIFGLTTFSENRPNLRIWSESRIVVDDDGNVDVMHSWYVEEIPCNITDKGVVINGVRWATRNVDMPGTFAETPKCFGMLFQWNRRKVWNVIEQWGDDWDSSMPTGTEWEKENDPCPQGWRIPTQAEWQKLIDVGSIWSPPPNEYIITTSVCINPPSLSEIYGEDAVFGRFFGTVPNQIFLPAAGIIDRGFHHSQKDAGFYWSNHSAIGFGFNRHNADIRVSQGNEARSIRCVAID